MNFIDEALDDSTNLNLLDCFWIMRLNVSSLLNIVEHHKKNKDTEDKILEIKSNIVEKYSEIFERDYLNFKKEIVNAFYEVNFVGEVVIKKDSDPESERKMLENISNDCPIISLFLKILKQIKIMKECLDKVCLYAKEQKINLDSICDFRKLKPVDKITTLHDCVGENYSKRNFPELFDKPDVFQSFKTLILKLNNNLSTAFDYITQIVNFSNQDFKKLLTESFIKDYPISYSHLIKFQYMLSPAFNYELILIFIWTDFKEHYPSTLLKVIEKYETFFEDIYKDLNNIHYPDKVNPISLVNDLFNIRNSYEFHDVRFILFKLKKIIKLRHVLQEFKILHKSDVVDKTLSLFDFILTETTFQNPPCDMMLKNLPSFLMKELFLTASDLAKIWDVDKSTISKQIKNGTIVKKNLWFWKAALDHTLTYFYGETTIPTYGKVEESSNVYHIQIAMRCSFAELFLKNIDALKAYSKNLKGPKNSTKKIVLSYEYLNQISNKTIALADKIKKSREKLDCLYENLVNAEQKYRIEKEFETSENQAPNQEQYEHESNLENAQKNFDTYLDSVLKKLEQCIKLFDV